MSKIADAEANATSLDGLVNDNGLIPTLRNGPKPSWQYLVDGWDGQIASKITELNKSRGFRVIGAFADGFTYELFNDVGIDTDGNSWIYTGAGAPNKVVNAGTVPSAPDYEQVTFNTASSISNANGGTVQDHINANRGVEYLKQLGTVGNLEDGQRFAVNGYYEGTLVGGGQFVWDASRSKADHNGGTVIAPEALVAWDGSQSDIASVLDWSGSGVGCFLRKVNTVHHARPELTPSWFGATGQGDDTKQIQACWNTDSSSNDMSGDVWSVSNLTIPNRAGFVLKGKCTISAIDAGDTYYMVASEKHLSNIAEAQSPIRIGDGVIFDAKGLKTHAIISQSWNSDLDIEVTGAVLDGLLISAQTKDGTTFPSSSMVNNRIKIRAHHNGGAGMYVQDAERNNATDGYILPGSYAYANGAEGVRIDAGAGWDVQLNTYGNAANGLRFNGVGKGTRVHNSFLDDDLALEVNAHLEVGLLQLDSSTILGRVTTNGTGNKAPYGIYSHDNHYLKEGHMYHSFFGADREMYSANDTFETADPFRFHNGSSTGRFIVNNAYLGAESRNVTATFDAQSKVVRLFQGDDPLLHKGGVFRSQSDQITPSSFSFSTDIFGLPSASQKAGGITILTRRFNTGTTRVKWRGEFVVSSKTNGTDPWVVDLLPIIETSSEWLSLPSITVTDNGDGTGTITIFGEPSDDDGYGRVNVTWS